MASLFLLASLSLAFLCICQADLISDICPKAINPTMCDKTLRSDPRSGGADLKGLGQIAIEKSVSETQAAIGVYKSNSNAGNKNIIDTCIETSNDAIDALNKAAQLLKNGNKADIQTEASAALTNLHTCDDEFGESEPPQVKLATKNAGDVISIVLAVANQL